jgi:hypothetical protein
MGAPTSALLVCNQDLYRFFLAQRGSRFAVGAVALHWLYYGYSTLAFAIGFLRVRLKRPA